MFISGRHCEVRYEKGGYWLYDVSRNGTFVNGSRQRIKSPHPPARRRPAPDRPLFRDRLDRRGQDAPAGRRRFAAPSRSGSSADNIWDTGAPAPPPINRRDLMPPQTQGQRSADFAEQFSKCRRSSRRLRASTAAARPAQRPPQPDPFADVRRPGSPFGGDAAPQSPFCLRCRAAAPPRQPALPVARRSLRAACPAHPGAGRRRPARPLEAAGPSRPGVGQGGAEAILRAIAAGRRRVARRLPAARPSTSRPKSALVLRTVVEELAILLKARAAAKVMAKSGNRTMISAVDNNPLKFVPRAGRGAGDHVRRGAPAISTPSTASTRRSAT